MGHLAARFIRAVSVPSTVATSNPAALAGGEGRLESGTPEPRCAAVLHAGAAMHDPEQLTSDEFE
ncbi:hypothetical protein OG905_27800 [Streptomyces sp. NBC_00322]|uniref:hypothetical protein n=1 Tax=Streptomyces sp. NBC_00322 TaxID=2975712 RepID=UPI002E27C832|nr:hypothetical protein [Streptomyces sp. NBC_00322]